MGCGMTFLSTSVQAQVAGLVRAWGVEGEARLERGELAEALLEWAEIEEMRRRERAAIQERVEMIETLRDLK